MLFATVKRGPNFGTRIGEENKEGKEWEEGMWAREENEGERGGEEEQWMKGGTTGRAGNGAETMIGLLANGGVGMEKRMQDRRKAKTSDIVTQGQGIEQRVGQFCCKGRYLPDKWEVEVIYILLYLQRFIREEGKVKKAVRKSVRKRRQNLLYRENERQ
jgi:hypothetical protein